MRTLVWVVAILDCIFILMIAAVRLNKYAMSKYALLNSVADQNPQYIARRKKLHSYFAWVVVLQRLELTIAAVVLASLMTYLYGVGRGVVYTLLILLLIAILARLRYISRRAEELFEKSIDTIVRTTKTLKPLWRLLGVNNNTQFYMPQTQDELIHFIQNAPAEIVNTDTKKRIVCAVQSHTKTVRSIMTPKNKVVSVKPTGILGPVLLSELQRSSHGYFPVLAKNGFPEGILQLSHLSDVQQMKTRKTIADIMQLTIVWAEEDMTIGELVQLFLQEKQYLVCVRNLEGDFVGIVTIADVMKHSLAIEKE